MIQEGDMFRPTSAWRSEDVLEEDVFVAHPTNPTPVGHTQVKLASIRTGYSLVVLADEDYVTKFFTKVNQD